MALNDDASRKATGSALGQKRSLPFSNTTMAVAGLVVVGAIGYVYYVNRTNSAKDNINQRPPPR